MLDQMFTAENFRRIYDAENRKGLDLASRYFPSLESHTLAVRNKVKDIRGHRAAEATMAAEVFEAKLLELKTELAELKAAKSAAVDDLMDDVSQKVLKPNFKIVLSQKNGPKGKPVFCIDAEPETFFVIKQLQRNIHRIYGVKQANRHDLVCQLRDMLGSKFPFELVRTDISSFYESIDRKRLIEKAFLESNGRPLIGNLEEVIRRGYNLPEREIQYFINELVIRMKRQLDPGNLRLAKWMVETKSWWDTVDSIATNIVGWIILNYRDQQSLMDQWSRDDNMWVRRTAILHQLKFKDETDVDRLAHYCISNSGSKEFFIQKSIGWALREYSKTDSQFVYDFVSRNQLANLSKREALKWLDRKA